MSWRFPVYGLGLFALGYVAGTRGAWELVVLALGAVLAASIAMDVRSAGRGT